MIDRQHTPGPWNVRDWQARQEESLAIGADADNAYGFVVIAEVFADPDVESMHKNAALIAAAPALLEFVAMHAEDGDVLAQRLVVQAKGGAL